MLRQELDDIPVVALIYSPARVVRKVTARSSVQQRLYEIFHLDRLAPG